MNPDTRGWEKWQQLGESSRNHGFEPSTWHALAAGATQPDRDPEDFGPGGSRSGWQHEATQHVLSDTYEEVFVQMEGGRKALVRSQGGRGAGLVPTICPRIFLTTFSPKLFRFSLSKFASPRRAVHSILVAITARVALGRRVLGAERGCFGGCCSGRARLRPIRLGPVRLRTMGPFFLTSTKIVPPPSRPPWWAKTKAVFVGRRLHTITACAHLWLEGRLKVQRWVLVVLVFWCSGFFVLGFGVSGSSH